MVTFTRKISKIRLIITPEGGDTFYNPLNVTLNVKTKPIQKLTAFNI
jgi:hypothetical protein